MMGKRKKRMILKKYAKKYALQRKTLGFDKEEEPMIILDLSGQEEKQEEGITIVSNKEPKNKKQAAPLVDLEPQLIQIEEPQTEEIPEVVAPKPTRKRRTRKKTATTSKSTTTKTTRRRTTKAKD